jgi:hypothetical protein
MLMNANSTYSSCLAPEACCHATGGGERSFVTLSAHGDLPGTLVVDLCVETFSTFYSRIFPAQRLRQNGLAV